MDSRIPNAKRSKVCDWLKEHYNACFSERTVSRYVKSLREEYNLDKKPNPRDYEAVTELPPGQQLQVDFGVKWMKNINGGYTQAYVAAFVLAHSRHKYAELQSRPYTTIDLIRACRKCFQYLGGMPLEMVLDQDSIVCVSENNGDIIHTYEFEKFRQEYKFNIYMCRGADPESKGKVENMVKYIKGNFLKDRLYVDDNILNESCLKWLERTGNAKVHGTTKRVPSEVFKEEQKHLRPYTESANFSNSTERRAVRKDNTIIYNSNRYSVPLGTYNKHKEVKIEPQNGIIYIKTLSDDSVCEHRISRGRGLLIQNINHKRDRSTSVDKLQNTVCGLLENKADEFLQSIRDEKARYARDQFTLLQTLCNDYGVKTVLDAVEFCKSSKLYSANYVRDYIVHSAKKPQEKPLLTIPVSDSKYHVTTQKRSIDVYAKAGDAR